MEIIKSDSMVVEAVERSRYFASQRLRYLSRRGTQVERDAARRLNAGLGDLAKRVQEEMLQDDEYRMAAESDDSHKSGKGGK